MRKGSQKPRARHERYELRLTASEKHLFQAFQDTTGYVGSADIFRSVILDTAKLALQYSDGGLSPEELKRMAGEAIAAIVIDGVNMKKAGVTKAEQPE